MLRFLDQCCSVVSPGEVLCDVHTQELGAAHSLHSRTVDGQRSMLSVHSPEVNNNLLRLLHIQREIVVLFTPLILYIYIYIYAFSRRFYPKRLTLHSSYSFYIFFFYQLLLSLGIKPMILALLAPCSTI